LSRDRLPLRADFCAFAAVIQAQRRSPLATCAVFLSVRRRTAGAAPHTYGGALGAVTTSAETTLGRLCDLETSLDPRTARCKGETEGHPFSSEGPGRGRGSPRGPSATLAAENRAGAEGQSRGQAPGVRPMGSCAVARQWHRQCSAPSADASRARPVRRQAPPLRS
jgi:hypothetical protein